MAVVRVPEGVLPSVTFLSDGSSVVLAPGVTFDAADPVVKELKAAGWEFVAGDEGTVPKVRRAARVETADRADLR